MWTSDKLLYSYGRNSPLFTSKDLRYFYNSLSSVEALKIVHYTINFGMREFKKFGYLFEI